MSLSVFCATRAEPHTPPFLSAMRDVADACHGAFVVVADGAEAVHRVEEMSVWPDQIVPAIQGIHQTMEDAIHRCTDDYVFCLDDDECCTHALVDWLTEERYRDADLWDVPRAWLYPDAQHHITGRKHWPNYDLRIGRQSIVSVPRVIHGGWLQGTGMRWPAPFAIEHHKLLIRSLEERVETVARYEAIKVGAGIPKQYVPERYKVDVAEWHR